MLMAILGIASGGEVTTERMRAGADADVVCRSSDYHDDSLRHCTSASPGTLGSVSVTRVCVCVCLCVCVCVIVLYHR